jgi:hypothetical protein
MDDLTPGPAMQCPMDETVVPVREHGPADCPECGEPMSPVTIDTCPNGKACDSTDHHFGLDVHLTDGG